MNPDAAAKAHAIDLKSVGNARDIGGYVSTDGRKVRKGIFLRTANLNKLSEEDKKTLMDQYHLHTIIDLRSSEESVSIPDPVIPGVKNLSIDLISEFALRKNVHMDGFASVDSNNINNVIDLILSSIEVGFISWEMYANFISTKCAKDGFRLFFQEIMELPDGCSLLFHCSQGKDRTGICSMLILTVLGADEETIIEDYMLTNEFNRDKIQLENQLVDSLELAEEISGLVKASLNRVEKKTLINSIEWMKEKHGSIMGYITDAVGISKKDILQLQERFLES